MPFVCASSGERSPPSSARRACREVDADLVDAILAHTTIPWTDTFREAEHLAAAHTETLGVHSLDDDRPFRAARCREAAVAVSAS